MAGIKDQTSWTGILSSYKPIVLGRLHFILLRHCLIHVFFYFFYVAEFGGCPALVTLAFAGSIGMTLVILGCALPQYNIWWTFFVVVFYMLAPLPTLIARRYNESSGSSGTGAYEIAIFITMGFVISSFALPIVLARSVVDLKPVIQWGTCYLTLAGNVVVYATLVGFFMTFDSEDTDYTMW